MSHRPMARSLRSRAGAVAAMLVVLVAQVVVAPTSSAAVASPSAPEPAQGDVNLIFSADGTPARYGANQIVRVDIGNINFIRGCEPGPKTAGFPDVLQPAADLYIVDSGSTIINSTPLYDGFGRQTTVFGGTAGAFFDAKLGLTGPDGKIPSGTYDVVVDECQNGMFDTGQDTIVRDAFRVDVDNVVPGFSTDAAEWHALKDQARNQFHEVTDIERLYLEVTVAELFDQVSGVLSAFTSVSAFGMFAITYLIGLVDPFAAARDRAKNVMKVSANQRRTALKNLAMDPPDPHFQEFASPVRVAPNITSDLPVMDDMYATASIMDALGSVEEAFLTAVERYQGAQQAGNAVWAARHARTLDELATLHDELSTAFVAAMGPVTDRYQNDWMGIELRNGFLNTFDSWNQAGYRNTVNWWSTGATPTQTEEAMAEWRRIVETPLKPGMLWGAGGYADQAREAAAGTRDLSAAMRTWADAALPPLLDELDVLNGDRVDPSVTIDPVIGAAAGADVVLSVDVPGDGTPDGVTWDLDGDGEFDDAVGERPTWTVPGDAVAGNLWVIGVEVHSAGGVDTAFAAVPIGAGNARPVIDAVDAGPVAGAPGATTTFKATASDPDGDDVTVQWLVDNEVVQTGGTFLDVPVPADFFGQTNVTVVATDEHGASSVGMWILQVHSGIDADRDLYEAFPGPDCDDTNAAVHPGYPEQIGNLIDDDCDPSTSDMPGGPGTYIGWVYAGFSGVEGDEQRLTIDGWGDAQRYANVPFRVEVEWADGTTSSQTIQGTTYQSTIFSIGHQYGKSIVRGDLRYCIYGPSDALVGCNQYRGVVNVVNKGPFVNPADFRTWKAENQSDLNRAFCMYVGCTPTATWVPNDPDGRAFMSTDNPNEAVVGYSPVPLSEGGYGRAMVELSVLQGYGDDDGIGFVLGYQPGEIGGLGGADDDFLSFEWYSQGMGGRQNAVWECKGTVPPSTDSRLRNKAWSRTRGPASVSERMYDVTFDMPDDGTGTQNPLCNDAFGIEMLQEIIWPDGALDVNPLPQLGGWLNWALSDAAVNGPPYGPVLHPYRFTVDYRADRLRMWTANGTLVTDISPTDPADPFPPGALGAIYQSQNGVRFSATAPEKEFAFTQGTSGSMTMPFTDGGIGETYSVNIDWGDNTSASAGTYTADPTTGHGWWTAAGEHVYQRAGSYRATVCVDDDEGDGTCFTFRAEVGNRPPVVDAGPDFVSGKTVSLAPATFTDPGALDDHTATIDWGDGTTEPGTVVENRSTGGLVRGAHDYATSGLYDIKVCVTDQGGLEDCDTARVDTRVANAAPTALIELPDPAVINQRALLGGGFTDPNPDDTHTITIDPGDGSGPTEVQGQSIGTFGTAALGIVYRTPGSYPVTVCVTDSADQRDCITRSLVVEDDGSNKMPTADAGGPYTVAEGSVVSLDGSASVDPDGDALSFAWDLNGDATFESPGKVVDFTGADGPATKTVALKVCDPSLACDTATVAVDVTNAKPLVNAGRDRSSGLTLTLDDSTFSDPGLADTHAATVNWGDGAGVEAATVTGNAAAGSVQASHTYASIGPRTVAVCVTDDDGGKGCDSFDVTVEASPIVVTVAPDIGIHEGGSANVDFTFADDDGGVHSATVRWADGSLPSVAPLTDAGTSGSGSASHVFADEGDYGVTVEVCDTTGCGSVGLTVRVANVAPAVEPPSGTVDGSRLAVEAAFTDPGVADTHTATIDWGDGTTSAGSVADGLVTGTHRYATAGKRTVKVCVTDNSGSSGCSSADLTVADPINDPPTVRLDPVGSQSEGTPFLLKGSFADGDSGDSWSITIDWGDGSIPLVETPSAPGDFEALHTYADDGVHTITATVDDRTDQVTARIVDLEVTNVAPSVSFSGVDIGLDVSLDIELGDPGSLDVLEASIDWGDGTTELATRAAIAGPAGAGRAFSASPTTRFTGAHRYGAAGTYDIEVCGADDDGGKNCLMQTIVLSATKTPTTHPGTTIPDSPTTASPAPRANPNGATPSVASGGTDANAPLPRTGAATGPSVLGGLALLLLGALLLLSSRFRRSTRRNGLHSNG